jgi:hypothetical protein
MGALLYCYITFDLFEMKKYSRNVMALQVNDILAKHRFNAWVIAYVEDKRSNLSTMTQALTFIVLCER